jgi:hypothetical protein
MYDMVHALWREKHTAPDAWLGAPQRDFGY